MASRSSTLTPLPPGGAMSGRQLADAHGPHALITASRSSTLTTPSPTGGGAMSMGHGGHVPLATSVTVLLVTLPHPCGHTCFGDRCCAPLLWACAPGADHGQQVLDVDNAIAARRCDVGRAVPGGTGTPGADHRKQVVDIGNAIAADVRRATAGDRERNVAAGIAGANRGRVDRKAQRSVAVLDAYAA